MKTKPKRKSSANLKASPKLYLEEELLGGFTAAQVIKSPQLLKAYLSQPRAVLFLLRELFERVDGFEPQLALVDSGIQTLAFIIGDKKLKAGKCT